MHYVCAVVQSAAGHRRLTSARRRLVDGARRTPCRAYSAALCLPCRWSAIRTAASVARVESLYTPLQADDVAGLDPSTRRRSHTELSVTSSLRLSTSPGGSRMPLDAIFEMGGAVSDGDDDDDVDVKHASISGRTARAMSAASLGRLRSLWTDSDSACNAEVSRPSLSKQATLVTTRQASSPCSFTTSPRRATRVHTC